MYLNIGQVILNYWYSNNICLLLPGRLLVGLRWWSYVDDEGKSHWKFESMQVCLDSLLKLLPYIDNIFNLRFNTIVKKY